MDHAKLHSPKRLKMEEATVKTRRGPWTAEEDELLTTLVKRFGTKKWAIIAELVPGRVGKQCRERWLNHLRTDVKKTAWTDEEDEILIKAQQELGNRWSSIAKLLPGRPENSVKNRWNSLVNKKKRSSAAEDTDNGNVSSDEHSTSDDSSLDEPAPTPSQTIPRRASFRVMGTPYADHTEARSLSVIPATTPNSGSPVVGSSFPIKTDKVPPPQPLPQWSLYPSPSLMHQHHQQQLMMREAQQQMMMMQHQQQLAQRRFSVAGSSPYMNHLSIPTTPYMERKPLAEQQPSHSPSQKTPTTEQPIPPVKGEETKGAAQGLLLLAKLCG